MLKRNSKNLRPITPIRSINGATFLPAVKSLHPLDPIPPIGYKSDAIVYGVNAMSLQPEAANSYADIITGGPLGTSQLRRTLDKNNLGFFKEIPLLNKVVGALALTKNQFIDPVFENRDDSWKIIGLNLLTNASETLDLFSNLVKSQFESAGGHAGLDSLAAAWGVGDHNTRKVYNFNTGNFFGDLALEIVSDPLNWISLGAKALAGSTIKAGADVIEETVEATVKSNVDELSKQLLKTVSKESAEDFAKVVTKEITENIMKESAKDITFDSIKRLLKYKTLKELDDVAKELIDNSLKSNAYKGILQDTLSKATRQQVRAFRWYQAALRLQAARLNVDKALTFTSYLPITAPYKVISEVFPVEQFTKYLFNEAVSKLRNYVDSTDMPDIKYAVSNISDDAFKKSEAFFADTMRKNRGILELIGKTPSELQEEYSKMLSRLSEKQVFKLKEDTLQKMFIKHLGGSLNDTTIQKWIKTDAARSFFRAIGAGPIALRKAELVTLHDTYLNQINKVMVNLKNKKSYMQKLEYLDKQLLRYNNKHYGLEQLRAFYNKVLINSDSIPLNYRNLIRKSVDELGINTKNYKQIAQVLNSNMPDKDKLILEIVKQTQDAPQFLANQELNKFVQAGTRYAHGKNTAALQQFFEHDLKDAGVLKYREFSKNQIMNIQDAVTRIQENTDLKKAQIYLKDVLRREQFADMTVIDKATSKTMLETEFEKGWTTTIKETLGDKRKELANSIISNTKTQIDFLKQTDRLINDLTLNKATPEVICDWYQTLESSYAIFKVLDTEASQVFVDTKNIYLQSFLKTISDLRKVYNTLTSEKLTIDLSNYLENINGMIQTQLSYYRVYDIFNQNLNLTADKQVRRVMNELMDRASKTRTDVIPSLIVALNEKDLTLESALIERTIAQIDMFIYTQKMFNTNLLIPNLTKKERRYIKTLLFDAIKNHDGYTIQQIKDTNGEKIINDILDFVTSNAQRKIKKVDSETIRESVRRLLYNYIDDISTINLPDFPIYSMYSANTIRDIRTITKYFKNLAAVIEAPVERYGEYEVFMDYLDTLADAAQVSIDYIKQNNTELSTYIKYQDAKNLLCNTKIAKNLFDASVASETYAIHHLTNAGVEKTFHINNKMFLGTNAEYMLLNNRLAWLSQYHAITDEIKEQYIENANYMWQVKNALIATYSNPNALFSMRNASEYFNSLNKEQLYIWDQLTLGNISKRNARTYRNLKIQFELVNSLEKTETTTQLNEMLEQVVSDKQYISEYAFDNVISIMDRAQFDEVNAYVNQAIMSQPLSTDDLLLYKDAYAEYIEKDVEKINDLFKTFKTIDKELSNYNNNMFDHEAYITRQINKSIGIEELTPDELAEHIANRTPGGLIFYNNNIVKKTAADGSVHWEGILNPFPYTNDEYAAAGLKKITSPQYPDLIFIVPTRKLNTTVKAQYKFPSYNKGQIKYQGIITDTIKKYQSRLNIDTVGFPLEYTTVEALPESLWSNMMKNEELQKIFGTLEEQKLYQNINMNDYNMFFNTKFSKLNYTIIGGYNALDYVQGLFQAPDDTIINHTYKLSRNTFNGLQAFVLRSNRVVKYTELFFNDRYWVGNALFKDMFKDATDDEINNFFKVGKYKAAVLKADAKNNPLVVEYKIYNRASWNRAIKSKAIILPDSIYRAAYTTINNRGLDSGIWGIYKRIIMPTYKGLDLTTAGFPFRNAADTLLYKNINELGLWDTIKYDYTASKMLRFHEEIQEKCLELTNYRTVNKESILKVLKEYPKEKQQCYFLIDFFVNSQASGGFSKSFQEYLEAYNSVNDLRPLWEKWYTDNVFQGRFSPIRAINTINNQIEQTGRLGLFLGLLDKGKSVDEAIQRVVKTHFDYSVKPKLLEFCEQLFWFSTFPLYNLSYYLNGGLTKNPALLRTLMDAETASWNNGEYTYEELKKTNFLAYHALTGNLRIGNTIIKLSPSVFDMLGLLTGPKHSALDRLNPFISIPLEYAQGNGDWKELLPFNTQRMNLQKFYTGINDLNDTQGSLIPSIYSKLNDKSLPPYIYGSRRRYNYRKSQWTRYPRIKKNPNLMRRYTKKFYARDYRWWHNRGLLSSLNLNQFGTTLMDPEYLTKVKILRAMRSFNHQKNYLRIVRP